MFFGPLAAYEAVMTVDALLSMILSASPLALKPAKTTACHHPGIMYMMGQLVKGQEVSLSALKNHHLLWGA